MREGSRLRYTFLAPPQSIRLPQSRRRMARCLSHEARRVFCAAARLTHFLHPSKVNPSVAKFGTKTSPCFKLNVLQSSCGELVDKDRSRHRSAAEQSC